MKFGECDFRLAGSDSLPSHHHFITDTTLKLLNLKLNFLDKHSTTDSEHLLVFIANCFTNSVSSNLQTYTDFKK